MNASLPTRTVCAVRWRPLCLRWSAQATRACRSMPISTSIASPRLRINSIPRAGWCDRARPARSSQPPVTIKKARYRSAPNCPAADHRPKAPPRAIKQEDRRNRQLRNFAHDQDRGDRSGPGQPYFSGGAGRRHLRQERQRRARLPAAAERRDRPHRRAGSLGHWLRCQAWRSG